MRLKELLPNFLIVHQEVPEDPIAFKSTDKRENENKEITIPELIDTKVPELADGATDTLYGLLVNGHLQTAYGSFRHFDNIYKVQYKRMIIKYPHGGEGTVDFAVNGRSTKRRKVEKEYVPTSQPVFNGNLKRRYS